MQPPTKTLSAPAALAATALLALVAFAPGASAHLNETRVAEAHGIIGAVCWELQGLVESSAVAGTTTLGGLLAAAVPAAAFRAADGSPLPPQEAAELADGLAAFDPTLAVSVGTPGETGVAPFTIGASNAASIEDLVTCGYGHGRYRSASQHTHVGTTLFETSSDQGDYTSGTVSAAWARPSGFPTGAIAILGLPFVVDDAGGGFDSPGLFGLDCHPFIRDLLATTTGDGSVGVPALTGVAMYADGYSPQLPALRVATTFCGWGVAYEVVIDSDSLGST